MSNHVHILLRPIENPPRVLQWLKGTTTRHANQFLCRTGKPFWQRESYDHFVRDHTEFKKIATYIEMNPVKAGVVTDADRYRWSSAMKFTAAR